MSLLQSDLSNKVIADTFRDVLMERQNSINGIGSFDTEMAIMKVAPTNSCGNLNSMMNHTVACGTK